MDEVTQEIAELALLVARAYGDEIAGALVEAAKAAPAAMLKFLRETRATYDSQWDPTVNPPA